MPPRTGLATVLRRLLRAKGPDSAQPRFYHSLTFKNLLVFMPIFLIAVTPLAYWYWWDNRENRIEALANRLELIAQQAAKEIDVRTVTELTRRDQTGSPAHRALVADLARIQRNFHVDNAVLLRRMPDGRFAFIADGSNQFFITQRVFIHDRFPETLRAAVDAWKKKGASHTRLFGFGLYEYLQVNKPLKLHGKVVALLLINKYAEDVDRAIKADTVRLLLLTGLVILLGAAVFWMFSNRMLSPLVRLKDAANRLAGGDLDVRIPAVERRDEVSALNESFRTMVRELGQSRAELQRNNEELRRALARVRMMEDLEKNLFKFVPHEVHKTLRTDPQALERGKIDKDVSVLFLDMEGSTLLTEAMEPRRIDRLVENYFSKFLDFIYENGGDITETLGDGLMIIFQGEDPAQHALNAVKTAMAIHQATAEISASAEGTGERVRINIGISSGPALVGFTKYESISGARLTFTASGRTTIVASRLETVAQGGKVLVSAETMRRVAALLDSAVPDCQVDDLGEMRLKNIQDPERVYRLWTPGQRDIMGRNPTLLVPPD